MSIFDLFLIAVGLSMDAFAVSICKGLSLGRVTLRETLIVGAWFGGFQALMPLLGYLVGSSFSRYITAFDHWIAFGLLVLIGGNMIRESLGKNEECECQKQEYPLRFASMLTLAVATSIDALAVGVSFAFLNVNIIFAVAFIGAITFVLSGVGMKVGSVFGDKYESKAELAGGVVLILIGLKILLSHLGFIPG